MKQCKMQNRFEEHASSVRKCVDYMCREQEPYYSA